MDYQFEVPQSTVKGQKLDGLLTLEVPEINRDGTPNNDRLKVTLKTALCTVKGGNNIDEQAVHGLDGTIKTFVNAQDFMVTIKGMIVSEWGVMDYPLEDVKNLQKILAHKGELEVTNDFLLFFGIYNVVVTDYEMNLAECTGNTQAFVINCLSDAPVALIKELI